MTETERLVAALALIAGLADLRRPHDLREALCLLDALNVVASQALVEVGCVRLAS
jgi:hypothetical protein